MGITVEEYLKNREACGVCVEAGQVEHCVTTMLSRPDNCLIYNSIIYNSDPKDNGDVLLLQQLRSSATEAAVLDYYIRAEPIVKKIKKVHGEKAEVWDKYYAKYVHDIILDLRVGNGRSAAVKIFNMVSELEVNPFLES